MTPNPIRKVLSSMRENGVKCLLLGGQACVLYGAAEFSRDTALAVLAEPRNIDRLRRALGALQAEHIAVPPFEVKYLEMGLAVHFRSHHPESDNIRIDIMAKMRSVDPFPTLWDRRTTVDVGGGSFDLLSLPDLVAAKKTQRDKDWPMIARLVEANYFANRDAPSPEQIVFWLRELRTPALLIEAASRFPAECKSAAAARSLLALAGEGREDALRAALREEEEREREADRVYWKPLKEELERLRRERRSK